MSDSAEANPDDDGGGAPLLRGYLLMVVR